MTDTTQGATDTVVVKERVATHELLDASGAVVDDEALATGIKYTLKATGKSFTYQVGGVTAGSPAAMLAVFGAKTLATNEASQVRQKDESGDQLGAIEERFLLIEGGKWVDRTGGVGAKVDLDALAKAIVEVGASKGKTAALEAVRAKLEDDKGFRTIARSNPEIGAAYAAIVGRSVKSVDDVFAAIG